MGPETNVHVRLDLDFMQREVRAHMARYLQAQQADVDAAIASALQAFDFERELRKAAREQVAFLVDSACRVAVAKALRESDVASRVQEMVMRELNAALGEAKGGE